MESGTSSHPAPLRASQLPRAVWIGGGLLSLAVAALAGALVMKSVGTPAAPSAPLALAATEPSAAPLPRAGTPVPPLPQDDVAPPPRTTAPALPVPAPALAAAPVPAAPAPAALPAPAAQPAPAPARAAPPCPRCGTVVSVTSVKVKGQGTGVGAVAGGLLGGVVGNQFGHGGGRTAMTVLGAVGGGFAGNEVEKHVRAETLFDVRVRMRDGSHRTFRQAHPPAVGARVVVDGDRLRIAAPSGTPRLASAPSIRRAGPDSTASLPVVS